MKSLFLKVLNNNQLILFIFFLTHISLMIIIGNFTGFAPDEYGYAEVLKYLYEDNQSTKNFLVWANSDLLFLQLLYLPAKLFILLGMSELYSIRLLSITLVTLTLSILLRSLDIHRSHYVKSKLLIIIGFYLPSFFLWTTLGLRESFIILWLTVIFIYSFKLKQSQNFIFVIPIVIGVYGLSQTKLYLFVLTAFSFIVGILIYTLLVRKVTFLRLVILIIILSPFAIETSLFRQIYIVGSDTLKGINLSSKSKDNELNGYETEGMTEYQFEVFLEDSESSSILIDIVKYIDSQKPILSNYSNGIAHHQVELSRPKINDPPAIIFGAIKILLLPFPLIENGSFFLNIVSVEAPLWYLLYVIVFLQIRGFRWRTKDNYLIFLIILVELFIFIIFSTLFEINLGTNLRHRSVLLILMLNLLAVIQNYKSFKGTTTIN